MEPHINRCANFDFWDKKQSLHEPNSGNARTIFGLTLTKGGYSARGIYLLCVDFPPVRYTHMDGVRRTNPRVGRWPNRVVFVLFFIYSGLIFRYIPVPAAGRLPSLLSADENKQNLFILITICSISSFHQKQKYLLNPHKLLHSLNKA